MINLLLSREKDPMGTAIRDYFTNKKASKIRVFSSQFDEDAILVSDLFRTYQQMPIIEQTALNMAKGNILDIGAGSGCHALALQDMGKDILAIDISPLSVEVMKERGVRNVRLVNLFDPMFDGSFDTILMLMNGSGIIGKLDNISEFFKKIKLILAPGGVVYVDSSDLKYLFEDEEDGSFLIDIAGDYYGEIDFKMQYKQIKGDEFDWLYIDFDTLCYYAGESGFEVQMVAQGNHYDYLAAIKLKNK